MELVQRILAYFLRIGYIRQQSNHLQIRLNNTRCLRMIQSSNAHQNRQIRLKLYQKMLRKFMRVRSIRIKISRSQNYLYKSATTSRAWPLPGVFLIPPSLLVVADLLKDAVESEGCHLAEVDFDNLVIKVNGSDNVIGACARAVEEILD